MTFETTITHDPIEIGAAIERARTPATGGTTIFLGTVRDDEIDALDLEVYDDMARADLTAIGRELQERYHLTSVIIIHRFGHLSIGDIILLIACGAPHRQEAFAACSEILERIKASVPIWKKEIRGTTDRWIPGHGE